MFTEDRLWSISMSEGIKLFTNGLFETLMLYNVKMFIQVSTRNMFTSTKHLKQLQLTKVLYSLKQIQIPKSQI